uniref:Uncharacterized protein n=1 Tax=Amazona collaria TaxID=241587 RepID=A0A8B9EYA5_9PSIT
MDYFIPYLFSPTIRANSQQAYFSSVFFHISKCDLSSYTIELCPTRLEHCQGWSIHNFPGQPIPVPHHPHSKDLESDFWNNNDSAVQQKWSSYPPKEFILNISP